MLQVRELLVNSRLNTRVSDPKFAEQTFRDCLGWSAELVERPRKPAPEKVLKLWAAQWAKEGVKVNWKALLPPRGFVVLPRRWVVERTFSWIDQNHRMRLRRSAPEDVPSGGGANRSERT